MLVRRPDLAIAAAGLDDCRLTEGFDPRIENEDGSQGGRLLIKCLMTRQKFETVKACRNLAGALAQVGIVLPSLGVEQEPVAGSGVHLVELGRARPDVIDQLAAVVRLGAQAQPMKPGLVTA
ncbi:hypothetical protein [Kitasatospora sp. HPMI-4]|uniref:hypothetical protein n=1 Tax=Kitasatospora sp. HPMI-4 TaxID=3448443 RepID=UPI003F522D5E